MTNATRIGACVVLALVWLAVPATAAGAGDGAALHAAIGAYMVAGFVDIASTEYGVGRNVAHEANPLFRPAVERGPFTAGLVKGTAHTALAWWLLRSHAAHPTRALWIAAALAGAQIAVDVSNARAIGRR